MLLRSNAKFAPDFSLLLSFKNKCTVLFRTTFARAVICNASSRLCNYGQPGDGGAGPAGESDAGRLQRHRTELQPGPAADRGGRWSERRKKLCSGKFRGQV